VESDASHILAHYATGYEKDRLGSGPRPSSVRVLICLRLAASVDHMALNPDVFPTSTERAVCEVIVSLALR
jgi:hypothetical protein